MKRTPNEGHTKRSQISRRELLKRMACGGLALTGVGTALSACAPALTRAEEEGATPTAARARSYHLPTDEGLWAPPAAHEGDLRTGTGTVEIERLGEFSFEAEQVATVRPDIFQPGHFSVFDILVHLSEKGDIALDYHFDETMDTHVVDALGGESGWWHNAHYSAGWFEPNVFRMDMYPY
ncbi:MAG: hypothetical protein PVG71_15840, partial [Anaerolineae bacterium]